MTGRRTAGWHDPAGTRGAEVSVVFDGRELPAREGEPLSAALLANGVGAVGAGTYTGRPRGVFGIGIEEPCAYVRVDSPLPGTTMVQATRVEAGDGLRAAGLAGYSRLPEDRTAAPGDKMWAHCDVLVVGAGPAGLAAARAAARDGARVILAEDRPDLGGDLAGAHRAVEGVPAAEWTAAHLAALEAEPEVRVLARTSVTGMYDHGELIALQRRAESHRLWHIRAGSVVLATGALERPIAFEGNDRPGVMLAGAAARYTRRHGVLPGRRAVVFGCHDEALWDAVELCDAGVALAAVADARPTPGTAAVTALRDRGVDVLTAGGVTVSEADADTDTDTAGHVTAASIAPIDARGNATGPEQRFECDLLAVSGGYDPAAALATHIGGRTRWSAAHAAFLPVEPPEGTFCAGAANGTRAPDAAAAEGRRAGHLAATGGSPEPAAHPSEARPADPESAPPMPLWTVTGPGTDESLVFADLQRDATLADIRAAFDAGLTSIEHIKRHTTIGTGPDQGRTSGVLTTGIVARWLGRSMDEVGGTTARPPWTPVPFTALAGQDRGELLAPARHTPMHEWHVDHDAVFEDVGTWKRARYYPEGEEDMRAAVLRECRTTRESVGVLDASTLGKIIVEGRDAGEFLDRIYTGNFSTLRVGRCRYGVMCTADGIVLDDGVVVRLSETRYMVTTTSGNAETVLSWLEEWSQTEWPELCVQITHVTDQWATISVVGPRSRDVVARLAPGVDLSTEAFAFMTFRDFSVAGVPARVLRVSFTGELTFEINVPAWYGRGLWEAVLAAGEEYGITPYGTETMHVLRAEKGFIVIGHETDGNVTPVDAGMSWALSKRKDFVGKRSLARSDLAREDREQLVGLLPEDTGHVVAEGAQLVDELPEPVAHHHPQSGRSASQSGFEPVTHHHPQSGRSASQSGHDSVAQPPRPERPDTQPGPARVSTQGRVTSSYASAALERSFALGLLSGGRQRHGERVYAVHLDHAVPVLVTDPVFYDKEGSRRDG